MTDMMKEWQVNLTWFNPRVVVPPFERPIWVIIRSSVNRGRGFKRHLAPMAVKIMQQDGDGDRDEGANMLKELEGDDWRDFQFKVVTTDLDDDLDFYSDSIEWWCAPPAVPVDDVGEEKSL